MALAFYTVDAKSALGLTDAGAGLYAVVLAGRMLAGNILWGYLGDHGGHKRVLEGGALGAALGQLRFAGVGPLLGGLVADRLDDGVVFLLSLLLGLAGAGVVLPCVSAPAPRQ